MGVFVNPSIESFEENLNADIFVDKSLLIKELNQIVCTTNKYLCVSRPRRFGKTMAENMLCAYYGRNHDTSHIFNNLKIGKDEEAREKYLKYLNAFNVLKIDCQSVWTSRMEKPFMQAMNDFVNEELIAEFPEVSLSNDNSVATNILKIYNETKVKFVIFFDEYDMPVRYQLKESEFQEYLDFLVSLFKSSIMAPAVALGYMTGILPIIKDKFQSKLNNFTPVTIIYPGQYTDFTGFTKEEVKDLCAEYDVDYKECEDWFDGYKFTYNRRIDNKWVTFSQSIFNPYAIVNAIQSREFHSYWNGTGSYLSIKDYITYNFDGTKDDVVRMLSGQEVDINVTSFCNSLTDFRTRNDVFTYLIHLGYLAYNKEEETCYIPNKEIRQEWKNAIETIEDYSVVFKTLENSKRLLKLTLNCEEEAVTSALSDAQQFVTSPISYNNEQSMQSAINLAYFSATNQYFIFNELPSGKGYADVSFIPKRPGIPAIIIELKKEQSAGKALEQIKNKQYFKPFNDYCGDVLFVGVNYDENKNYKCKIDKLQK